MIYGNIDGIRKSALDELESLYKAKTPKDEACSLSIMETISRVSSFIEREISVAIDRRGNTVSVAIGDSTSVEIPTLDIREKIAESVNPKSYAISVIFLSSLWASINKAYSIRILFT